MPNSAVTTNVLSHTLVGKFEMVFGTFSVSSGTYPTGGIPVSFSDPGIKSSKPPSNVWISGLSGYVYTYTVGADKNSGTMQIWQAPGSAGPLTQITGNTPAAVTTDTISFVAYFPALR